MSWFGQVTAWLQRFFFFAPATGYYGPVVDISKWQGEVDFEMMKAAGVELVILRLSQGQFETDPTFAANYAGARAAGLKVGAYHVVHPEHTVDNQWWRIISSLGGRALDIPLALDCELDGNQNPSTVTSIIVGLVNVIKAEWGQYAPLYTRAIWWNQHTVFHPVFGNCPLWIARYWNGTHPWSDAPETLRPRDWTDFALWQWSADGNGLGQAYGVSSDDIDLNHGNAADVAGLLAKLNGAPVNPPPIDPPPGGNEDKMQTCKCVTLGSYIYERSKPSKAGGYVVGKFYKNATASHFPAQRKVVKADEPNKEIWRLCLFADGTVGWAAEWHPDFKDAAGKQYPAVVDV